jgi:hypothetical protein
MRFPALVLALLAGHALATEPLPAAELYSFNDLYRVTVGAPAPYGPAQLPAAAEQPVRVAVVEAAPAEPRFSFSVRQLPAPERWLLALAGLALAGWVAHRRLSYL